MIDRKARSEMSMALRRYLNDEIANQELIDAAFAASQDTTDKTVEEIDWLLWNGLSHNRHGICVNKHNWQYLNRLLLLLASDSEYPINPYETEPDPLSPFPSFRALLAARRKVPAFARVPFRPEVEKRWYFWQTIGRVTWPIFWFLENALPVIIFVFLLVLALKIGRASCRERV